MAGRPTMNDVARAAGVSKNTVSLALRHSPQIPVKTRERILRLARRMGYSLNPTVACLMAELRRSRQPGSQAGLALVNANLDRRAFREHPTIPSYVSGCRRRASELGYFTDDFWLHEPGLSGAALVRRLRARNLRGIVLVGLMHDNRLPDDFRAVWEQFPTVVTGVRTQNPALPFAASDHHMLLRGAVEECLRAGRRRPGLVIDRHIDRLVEGRFRAGFAAAQGVLRVADRLPPFLFVADDAQRWTKFREWFTRRRPDVLLSLYHDVEGPVRTMGLRVPEDVGLVQLEWRPDHPHWAGMDQHNDITGEAAVEMVTSMIQNGYHGVPAFPRATFIGSTWRPGATLDAVSV
ncbi:MAG: LacI family DNA-binding transcriptional regulator [Terrimicrobiaceae bacterium]|nr:LacI family DNA-binding transcriptional regulator [Terrimicrobiaceae bacterium]